MNRPLFRLRSWLSPAAGLLALFAGAPAPAAAEAPAAAGETEWAIPARLAPRSLLLDAARRGDLVIAVGERGHILRSQDDGATWEQARVPSRSLLTAIWLHDERLGWAVGHDETILRTVDGGRTWERVHSAPEAERPLLDVWFADDRRGFAVGAYGAFLATTDGGGSWDERRIGEDDFHLNGIGASADGTLYLAAEAGHLYRSTDGGSSWSALPSPYAGSFYGVLPLADGAVLAFGLRGHLFRSTDRGASWTAVPTGTVATLTSGIESGGGHVAIAGLAGVVVQSADGGRTFAAAEQPDHKGFAAIVTAADGRALLLFGEGGSRRLEGTR